MCRCIYRDNVPLLLCYSRALLTKLMLSISILTINKLDVPTTQISSAPSALALRRAQRPIGPINISKIIALDTKYIDRYQIERLIYFADPI